MSRFNTRRLRLLLAVGTLLGLTAGAGLVYAGIPSSDGTLYGCYQTRGGLLRVIDHEAGEACRRDEAMVVLENGLSLGCPADTIAFAGACIEDEARTPATHPDATSACAADGRRLPSPGELSGFRDLDGVTLTSPGEWSDDLGDVTYSTVFVYYVISDRGNSIQEAFEPLPYRCAAGPELG